MRDGSERLLVFFADLMLRRSCSSQLNAGDDDADQQREKDSRGRADQELVAPDELQRAFPDAGGSGQDRLVAQEALQVRSQLPGRDVALRRLLVQTLEADCL